jgi:hypothetical protein
MPYLTNWERYGYQDGLVEGKLETARALVAVGVSPELIAQTTGLKVEEFNQAAPLAPGQEILLTGNYEIVREALRLRRPLTANYAGHQRLLCPHLIGWKSGPAGRQRFCLFYQFGGGSSRGQLEPDGSPENFRCWDVDLLQGIKPVAGSWHTAPAPSEDCLDEIDLSYWVTPAT